MNLNFIKSLKPLFLFIFSILNLVCSIFVLSYIAHTKNLSLDFNSSIFFAINIQQIHGIALLFSSALLLVKNSFLLTVSSLSFCMGIVLFSLNIYISIFFNINNFSQLIPFGGILLFVGWITLIIAGIYFFSLKNNHLK